MTANLKPVKIPQSLLLNKDLTLGLKCLYIYLLTCAMKCNGIRLYKYPLEKLQLI